MPQWTSHSNVADVLSLGPRTAGRLMQVGVRTVAELLAAEPQVVALRMKNERITAETLKDWQREAQLILAAPQLPPQAARILAVARFASPEKIARSTPTELLAAIEMVVEQGGWLEKISRPTVSELATWIGHAQKSLTERAA